MSALLFCPWISGTSGALSSSSSNYFDPSRVLKIQLPSSGSSGSCLEALAICKSQLAADFNFALHDALDSSGLITTHAREAREGFYSQIQKLSAIEKETSICINKGVDLGRASLYIAAEDDSLVSHSSVPLPVEDFLERLDDLSVGYCSHYSSSFRSSPEDFLECLERYLYVDKGFRRSNARHQSEQRALYLHSVLTHRSGSASMLSLIYSEILKMLRLWGLLDFDAEVFFPRDVHSSPRGYHKTKGKVSDLSHIMTPQSLLVEMLKDLKGAFWPFQLNDSRSLFLRAAQAANFSESASELASVKAAQHRLQRGVWTSVRFGDMRRALSACERLILLDADPKDLRDYAVLLYHCGFYKEALQYLKLYRDKERPDSQKDSFSSTRTIEEDAVDKLMIRVNLILMEEGWSRPSDHRSSLGNNSEPW